MTSDENIIGKYIICGDSGIGKIVDIASLQKNGERFFKVDFPGQQCVNYYSMVNQQNYRILGTKDIIKNAIEVFKSEFDAVEYSSLHEKINVQKELLKESDICKLAKTLSILNTETNLHQQISKPFKCSLKTFIDEIKFVLGVKLSEVYSLLEIQDPKKSPKK